MKKLLLYIIPILMCSCSLNIKLEDQFSDPDAITDVPTARSLLASGYSSLPDYQFELSVLSDDFYPSSYLIKDAGLDEIYQWRERAIISLSSTIWVGYYETVGICNALLNRIDKIATSNDSDATKLAQIKAEAKVLKAKCYFDLLRLFAPAYKGNEDADGIILKDRLELSFLPRSSVKQSAQAIRDLLTQAIEVKNDTEIIKFSDRAASYLLAQLELYCGNYGEVISITEPMVGDAVAQTMSEESYKDLWTESQCDERIFAKSNLLQYYTSICYDYEKGDYLVLNDNIQYKDGDVRKEWSEINYVINGRNVRLLGKYNKINYDKMNHKYINHFRNAGVYLMRAEALAQTNQTAKAVELMNVYLEKRQSEMLSDNSSTEQLLTKILNERKLEFVGEGVRYFDLKRFDTDFLERYREFGQSVSSTITKDDYRWTFPIPTSEYRYNPNASQNKGWSKIGI